MIFAIVKKEILGFLKTARFALAFILFLLIFSLTSFSLRNDYKRSCHDYDLSLTVYQESISKIAPLGCQPFVQIRPSPLSLFFKESISTKFRTTTKPVSTPIDRLFPIFDLSKISALLLSLIAVLLTFDAISGEREKGTLKLILAGGISKADILIGKFYAIIFIVALSLIVSLLISFIICWKEIPVFLIVDWIIIFLFIVSSFLFIAVFVSIGLLISVLFRSTETCLIIALSIWILFVLVIPNVMCSLANVYFPTPSNWDVLQKEKILSEAQTAERDTFIEKYLSNHPEAIDERIPWMVDTSSGVLKLQIANQESEFEIQFSQRKAIERQINAGFGLSRISPYSSMVFITQTLTNTGIIEYKSQLDRLNRYLRSWLVSWNSSIARDIDRTRNMSSEIPFFSYTVTPVEIRIKNCTLDVTLLVIWTITFLLGSFVVWIKQNEI